MKWAPPWHAARFPDEGVNATMPSMIRTAFALPDRERWTGGYQYFVNLFRVIAGSGRARIRPVVFVDGSYPEDALQPLHEGIADVVRCPRTGSNRWRSQLTGTVLTGIDRNALSQYRKHDIQAVFESATWHGWRFPLPVIAWLPDFQHRRLPGMFARRAWLQREVGFRAQIAAASAVMLSSESARQDCEALYPASIGKTSVIPFAVEPSEQANTVSEEDIRVRYGISGPYFYLPNQFWRHKNHAVLIRALRMLRDQGVPAMVVASGASVDPRHPQLFETLVEQVKELGLGEAFRFLRLIPRADVYALMRGSIAVVNPSLFEGWSTTVEEAKAIGVPLVLSDIPVHREQTAGAAEYFDPLSPGDAAAALARAIDAAGRPVGVPACQDFRAANRERLEAYARRIEDLIERVAGSALRSGASA